jgi:fatty-acyl-CoA synthase
MPNVIDVQVVGVKDDKFGEEVAALILVKSLEDNKLTKESVLLFCKDTIAFYKIPTYVKFVVELPLTVTGKPQKFLMRKTL